MATSGSYDFSATADEIINAALEDIGVIAEGQTPSAAQTALCLKRLNFLVKQWQGTADMARGLKVWTRQRVTMFLALGQQSYLIGPASTDSRATTLYGRTTLSGTEAAGQTILSITSNTDAVTFPGTTVTMTNGDAIGIVLDDGTLYWSAISGTPSTTATITVALPSQASAGNYVYWYTAKAQRFPVLEYAALRNDQLVDMPMNVYTDVTQYEALTNKTRQGDPVALLPEPLRLSTRITLDAQPQDVTKQVRLTVFYPAEDYDAAANDIAFPQEWFAALEWELALRIVPAFGAAAQWTPAHQQLYTQATAIARQLNPENIVAYFEPDRMYTESGNPNG